MAAVTLVVLFLTARVMGFRALRYLFVLLVALYFGGNYIVKILPPAVFDVLLSFLPAFEGFMEIMLDIV